LYEESTLCPEQLTSIKRKIWGQIFIIDSYSKERKIVLNLCKSHPGNGLRIHHLKEVIEFLKRRGEIK